MKSTKPMTTLYEAYTLNVYTGVYTACMFIVYVDIYAVDMMNLYAENILWTCMLTFTYIANM